LSDGTYTFQVRAIGSEGPDPTPASYTWTVNTSLPSNLVGYWAFDETTGTTASDSSGYGNDGTVNGATWTTGKVNGALSFDGTNDRVEIPGSTSLSLDTNQVTFATWLYADTLDSSWSTVMQRSNAAGNWYDWQIYARASDAPTSYHPVCRIDFGGSMTNEQVEGDIVLQPDTWYYLACTYDGTALKFYIDGTLRNTTPMIGGTIPNSGNDVWLGGNDIWGEYFDGILDETRIYNQALSQAEIQALMEGTPPPTCYALTLGHTGQGSDPVASPTNSTGCPADQYLAGEDISLSGATPDTDWQIGSWTGTADDTSIASTNTVSMPASDHTVNVNYIESSTSLGVGTYDDTDPAWSYSSGWIAYTGSGPYNNTLHYSATIDDYATLAFEGTQFRLTYTGHINRGQMDVYVDDVKVGTIDQYNPTLAWQKTWTSPVFTDGVHTLKLVHTTGTYIDIDAIEINPYT